MPVRIKSLYNVYLNWETTCVTTGQVSETGYMYCLGYELTNRVGEIAEFGKGFGKWVTHPPIHFSGNTHYHWVLKEHHIVLSTFASHFPSIHDVGNI